MCLPVIGDCKAAQILKLQSDELLEQVEQCLF